MANPENLKPWKKGQSGNPTGNKPGYKTAKTQFRKWLAVTTGKKHNTTGEEMDGYDAMILSLITGAIKGDRKAAAIVLDRLEGKPLQKFKDETEDPIKDAVQDMDLEQVKELLAKLRG